MPIFLSLALIACGSQKSENADEASADSVTSVTTVTPMDSLAMVKEESELLKTLLPDLCSRKFPTEEEIKMWKLIVDDEIDRKEIACSCSCIGKSLFRK